MFSPDTIDWEIVFEIIGEPASKANSRKIVTLNSNDGKKGRKIIAKSEKALAYVDNFKLQCPKLSPLIDGDVFVWIDIWYASRRPDLDESVILDAMQGRIYGNDRQVKQRFAVWHLDQKNPRSLIRVTRLS